MIANLLQTDINSITRTTNNMVDLSSNQTIGGIKTFTSSPQVPTLTQANNTTSVASTAYVDTGLATKQATLTYDTAPTSSSDKYTNMIRLQIQQI